MHESQPAPSTTSMVLGLMTGARPLGNISSGERLFPYRQWRFGSRRLGSACRGLDLSFVGSGVAIHSTYWHNNYGVPTSRGCVNASPEDSKWIFRWTMPAVPYDPGDMTVSMPGRTMIEVIES